MDYVSPCCSVLSPAHSPLCPGPYLTLSLHCSQQKPWCTLTVSLNTQLLPVRLPARVPVPPLTPTHPVETSWPRALKHLSAAWDAGSPFCSSFSCHPIKSKLPWQSRLTHLCPSTWHGAQNRAQSRSQCRLVTTRLTWQLRLCQPHSLSPEGSCGATENPYLAIISVLHFSETPQKRWTLIRGHRKRRGKGSTTVSSSAETGR